MDQSVQLLRILSISCFALAGVLLLVSVLLFLRFDIPSVLGSLTGFTAKRGIADQTMRLQSGNTAKLKSSPARKQAKKPGQADAPPTVTPKRVTSELGKGSGRETTLLPQRGPMPESSHARETALLDVPAFEAADFKITEEITIACSPVLISI